MSTILSSSAWFVNSLTTSITILLVYFNRFLFLKKLGRSWADYRLHWRFVIGGLAPIQFWKFSSTSLSTPIFFEVSFFTAPYVVKWVCDSVVKFHGLPKMIVTYCHRNFLTLFWKKFFALMGKKLVYNMRYQPQTDGQNKRVNNAFMTPNRNTIICSTMNLIILSNINISTF
jgi:hypothetical protein